MIRIVRVAQGKKSTLSHLYIDDLFACYLLEDTIREEKIAGETCIPEGEYRLAFNHSAEMNGRYRKWYPEMHRGMIEIIEIPSYSRVFIHRGNDHTDTAGCPLTGLCWQYDNGEYTVIHSAAAYRRVYPALVEEIEKDGRVVVLNRCFTTGTRGASLPAPRSYPHRL